MVSSGRPRLVVIEHIVETGKRIVPPRLSVREMTKELDVSKMSIYRIVRDPEELRTTVAEGIVAGHVFPGPTVTGLGNTFAGLTHTLRNFTMANPGIGQYLTRFAAPRHEFTIRLTEGQQAAFVSRSGYPPAQANLLVSTIAEHAIILGEINPLSHDNTAPGPPPKQAPAVRTGAESIALLNPQEYFEWSIQAMAWDSVLLLDRENLVAQRSSSEIAPKGAK